MAHRSEWPPVFPGINQLPDSELHRPYARLPRVDAELLISVAANSAVITYICQLAIKQAADYVRTNNISYADNERLFKFLRERSVAGVAPTEAHAPDDAGRGKGGGEQAKDAASERPVSRKGTKRGSRS